MIPTEPSKSTHLTVCLVSDFFCPNTGGVESHIYYLAQCMIKRGHTVIVVTHSYGKRRGVRFFQNGIKVYYLPFLVFYNGCTLPTVYSTLLFFRKIFIHECIDIVHGHSSFSVLAHEAMFHAQAMNIRTVFTDHSLFGFADASSILTNKLLQLSLCNCEQVICVSHTSKENTVLRANLHPERVSVIPNAVACELFQPDKPRSPLKWNKLEPITVVIVSRLVYRKGTDLLPSIIWRTCNRFPEIQFIIAGDGPKRILLEELREKEQLLDRVHLLGALPHSEIRSVLNKGQIFLNTSLTEAFCMAIVEAASCGLHVVTTDVGGIGEVLPPDLVSLAEPSHESLINALEKAILQYKNGAFPNPWVTHERIKKMYCWVDVAKRTENVYLNALGKEVVSRGVKLKRYQNCGLIFGIMFQLFAMLNYIFLAVTDYFDPRC